MMRIMTSSSSNKEEDDEEEDDEEEDDDSFSISSVSTLKLSITNFLCNIIITC